MVQSDHKIIVIGHEIRYNTHVKSYVNLKLCLSVHFKGVIHEII